MSTLITCIIVNSAAPVGTPPETFELYFEAIPRAGDTILRPDAERFDVIRLAHYPSHGPNGSTFSLIVQRD